MPNGPVLQPRSVERPADAGWTLVGGLDAAAPLAVDGGGGVGLPGQRWSLDWWVGAEDRWHYPSREPSIRQGRLGFGPVIETSMRIPSGDAVQTVYPVMLNGPHGRIEATVIEVRNDSPGPIALAFAVRPFGLTGSDASDSSDVPAAPTPSQLGPDRLIIGDTTIALPRPAGATTPQEAGIDVDVTDSTVLLYPMPHKSSLRFVVGPGLAAQSAAGVVPDADVVARGWTSVVDAGARFEFADEAVTRLMGASRSRLLLGDTRPAAAGLPADLAFPGPLLKALAIGAHDAECRRWLVALAERFPEQYPNKLGSPEAVAAAASTVGGVGLAAAMVAEPGLTEALLEPMATLTNLVERAKPTDAVQDQARRGLGALALVAGQGDAAASLFGSEHSSPLGSPTATAGFDDLVATMERSAPAGRFGFDDREAAARFVAAARSLLLAERPGSGGAVLDLLPTFPTAWRGGPIEVHNAPTLWGRVSFAIRWHGARPALLWDCTWDGTGDDMGNRPLGNRGETVTLRCPGLDPEWSTTEAKGETLLAGAAEPLPAAPSEGESFA